VLGEGVLGSSLNFELHVRVGGGAYICGEENLHAAKPGGQARRVRAKPPIPAINGPVRQADGGEQRADPDQRADDPRRRRTGLSAARRRAISWHAGLPARRQHPARRRRGEGLRGDAGELVNDYGGGSLSGRPVRAVQVGGPLGAYLPTSRFDLPMDYEGFIAAGAMVGHGGIVVFDDTVDMASQARFAMEFCAAESCGSARRAGWARYAGRGDRPDHRGEHRDENLALLEDLCDVMTEGSLCAMGGLTPMPVRSAIQHFPDDFYARARKREGGR